MDEIFENYLKLISAKFSHTDTSEMGYRTEFEMLLNKVFSVIKDIRIGHDSKSKWGNKPDFIVFNKEIPILYIETKDIGISLDKVEKSEQMKRYFGYSNLILTDYVEFRFYRNGIRYGEPIKIANYNLEDRTITQYQEQFIFLAKTILNFIKTYKEPIKSGKHLAQIMGGKAQRIRNDIQHFSVEELKKETSLVRLYRTLKKLLVHDLDLESFADMYAQTLVYGLFVARYHDKSPESFSRQEARELIPNSNPFLRRFFDHIVGADFDTRLKYVVDELCNVFSHADVKTLMEEYFSKDKGNIKSEEIDPVIHFYEDFLAEYDPELRKKMGAYYTPKPVVNFIVNSVDELLKTKFNLVNGLANTSKTDNGLHRVQVLDPATGTGTFISSVIANIRNTIVKNNQEGRWFSYIHNDLLPRIHGFELMMAPYTIAHLRLGIEFRKMGFWDFHRRLGIYLTNTLEEGIDQQDLFSFGLMESIAEESKEASIIKNNTSIMVILGNPPYSGESSNKGYKGTDVYKKEPSGEKLKEKNVKWLNDDYVKFIRYAESMIEDSGEGIVAVITAHGYIDNPTFRGMRYHLMKTFNELYIIDLHGNTNKGEKSPSGEMDQNVFNIKTGVSILMAIKTAHSDTLANVYKADLYGTKISKLSYLNENNINTVKWDKLHLLEPEYEWNKQDLSLLEEYSKGFSINDVFPLMSVGIVTARDKMSIQDTQEGIEGVINDFMHETPQTLRLKYNLGKDVRDWKVLLAKEDVIKNYDPKRILSINYKPFDKKWTFYTGNSKGFHCMPRGNVMNNLIQEGISLVLPRQVKTGDTYQHAFVAEGLVESTYVSNKTGEIGYVIPLYIINKNNQRVANMDERFKKQIEDIVGTTTPENILDYIYAVLYSNKYKNRYKSLLIKGFPIIPFPKNKDIFQKLVVLGDSLRSFHLLTTSQVCNLITSYPESGSDTIEFTPKFKNGKIYINDIQYFGNVPEETWEMHIGAYKPAQKWLKDRVGLKLTNEDIEHYQNMIVALEKTIAIAHEIDEIVEFE